MTYAETLDYILHKLPMFSRVGAAAYKKDLSNTIALCSQLGKPHHQFKSIHVGGTNGKGSTSHMLASILQASGYKTGLYTSPHLYDFRERIKVDGEMISEEAVVSFIQKLQPLIEKLEPSFFEITVAMAFEYFAQQKVDIAVVEVGLGGRLDSTNIIHPELSVITNISLDHTTMLGNTIEEIAAEKAGIIKKGAPVVIGERDEKSSDVFLKKAKLESAPIVFASDEWETFEPVLEKGKVVIAVKNKTSQQLQEYEVDLGGYYQTKNICTVLSAVEALQKIGYNISESSLVKGLKETKKTTGLYGRWDLVQEQPTVIADVAHNEAGIKEVLLQLKKMEFKNLHLVIGMVKDKAIDDVLALLPQQATYYFTQSQIPRALPAEKLEQMAAHYNLKGTVLASVNKALTTAKINADKDDLILVCGSIFLIAEIENSPSN